MKKQLQIFTAMLVLATLGARAQQLRVEPNTSIRVETGAILDISAGDLVLESGISGDASLIDIVPVTYSGGGQARVERYLTQGAWHLVSPPVGNALSGLFIADYLQYHSESTNGWTEIIPVDIPLNPGQGYALWSIEAFPTTEVFPGMTNSGPVNRPFSQNGLGWNLAGNPYPSAIDWDEVSIPSGLNGAIWLFDPTIGSLGDYRYYIAGGGPANTATSFIPSGQGFFVRATGGPGTLALDNDCRVHSNQSFYKNSNDEMLVLKTAGNGIATQTAIRFNENATGAADRLYDVYRIIPDSPDVPVLFTMCGDEKMAINTYPSVEGNETVPLFFTSGTDGMYTITATETESIDPFVPVFLFDKTSGIYQDLRSAPEYSFYHQAGKQRQFMVYFRNIPETNEPLQNNLVNCYVVSQTLHVDFSPSLSGNDFRARIDVSSASGQALLSFETRDITNEAAVPLSAAVYFVRIAFRDQIVVKKVNYN